MVAIPTFIWLPREFDEIRGIATLAKDEAVQARLFSEESRNASTSAGEKIDDLVIAIARMDAKPVDELILAADGITFSGKMNIFGKLLPPDVFGVVMSSGRVSDFMYSDFGGDTWIFIKKSSYLEFDLEQQKMIEDALARSDVNFVVE